MKKLFSSGGGMVDGFPVPLPPGATGGGSEPEGPDPGHYYNFSSGDYAAIFTSFTTSKFDDGSAGDATTDERSGQLPGTVSGTVGIYFNGATEVDELRINPGRWGDLSIFTLKLLDLDGVTWITPPQSPPAIPSNSFSYQAAGVLSITWPDASCLGLRLGIGSSGNPFCQVGCFDLRAYNDGVEVVVT